jgi:hypothetical protein
MPISILNRPGVAWLPAGLSALLAFAPIARAQPQANECSVAEFRALALDTHDSRLREDRANRWLDENLKACNLAQLRALGSNRGAWLGVADTATLAGRIDGAIERRVRENPDEVKALFSPAPAQEAPPRSTASGETPAAPRTRIVGPGTPAVVSGSPGAPAAIAVPVPVPVPVQTAAGSAAGPAPAGAPSAGGPAAQAAPPEPPARFAEGHREAVRNHYERSVVAGECPPTLQARARVCESVNPIRLWRIGDPLPVTAAFQGVPPGLESALPPLRTGLSVVRLGNDILLIDPNRRVIDAITDLGSPRAASAQGTASGK